MGVVIYTVDMLRYNTKKAVNAYLSECTTLGQGILPEEIIYEIGGPRRQGLLSRLNLPDVTIKPHRDMILLIGGTAAILAAGAVGTAYILKRK